jgi:hypothetical protein
MPLMILWNPIQRKVQGMKQQRVMVMHQLYSTTHLLCWFQENPLGHCWGQNTAVVDNEIGGTSDSNSECLGWGFLC